MPTPKKPQVKAEREEWQIALDDMIEEIAAIQSTLADIKRHRPEEYSRVYDRYLLLIAERDRIKAEHGLV